MDLTLHCNIHLFPMILLAIIYFTIHRDAIQTTENRLFQALLLLSFLLLFTELFSWMIDGRRETVFRVLSWIMNCGFFALAPLVVFVWLNLTYFYQHQRTLFKEKGKIRALALMPLVIYYVIFAVSLFTGWIYVLDENNRYMRGEWYFLPYVVALLYLVGTLIILVRAICRGELQYQKQRNKVFLRYTLLPIFACAIQGYFYNLWIALPVAALAELFVYIYIQNQQITSDALTGLNNRGYFDTYYKHQVEVANDQQLYLFVIDMDHFKSINDEYGHTEGDRALTQAAELIGKVFLPKGAFLARYGGDEFCAIAACNRDEEAVECVDEVQQILDEYNTTGSRPYRLAVSMGYAAINMTMGASGSQILRRADEMMYENKRRGRA